MHVAVAVAPAPIAAAAGGGHLLTQGANRTAYTRATGNKQQATGNRQLATSCNNSNCNQNQLAADLKHLTTKVKREIDAGFLPPPLATCCSLSLSPSSCSCSCLPPACLLLASCLRVLKINAHSSSNKPKKKKEKETKARGNEWEAELQESQSPFQEAEIKENKTKNCGKYQHKKGLHRCYKMH